MRRDAEIWARRLVNVLAPLVFGYAIVLAAVPGTWLEGRLRDDHERLVQHMRTISLSQTWSMYAPDAATAHHYLVFEARDADGTLRPLEEYEAREHGWGTVRGWEWTRNAIWQTEISRRIDESNRNRTWYARGLCLREARRGHDVERLELTLVSRSIRSPQRVREGADLLSRLRTRRLRSASCRVRIIEDMIALDRERRGSDSVQASDPG